MSLNYADGLSNYDDLGVCGLEEVFEQGAELDNKIFTLAQWIKEANGSCIVHVGAGISTAAGIQDFRGPKGIWTQKLQATNSLTKSKHCLSTKSSTSSTIDNEAEKKEPSDYDIEEKSSLPSVSFDEAIPTFTHMALKQLIEDGYVDHIVSQNIDGLFLKANLKRANISELHGNFFLDECTKCRSRFIRSCASLTMGLKKSQNRCKKAICSGTLRDTILDWETPLPHNELRLARSKSKKCKLHICIGTTMQLKPANELPIEVKRGSRKGKLVMINLQPTKLDKKSDLVIHSFADQVMRKLVDLCQVTVSVYNNGKDPTKLPQYIDTAWQREM